MSSPLVQEHTGGKLGTRESEGHIKKLQAHRQGWRCVEADRSVAASFVEGLPNLSDMIQIRTDFTITQGCFLLYQLSQSKMFWKGNQMAFLHKCV